MSRMSRLAALGAGTLALAVAGLAPVASAATAHTLHLHGSMYAHKAMAAAVVTQVSKDDYRVKITASGLPAPDMIHTMPRRHAYLAWAIDGMDKGADMMMAAIPLTFNKAAGTYTANRVIMTKHVTRVFVTADKSAMQHAPTKPEIIVLDSTMTGGM